MQSRSTNKLVNFFNSGGGGEQLIRLHIQSSIKNLYKMKRTERVAGFKEFYDVKKGNFPGKEHTIQAPKQLNWRWRMI